MQQPANTHSALEDEILFENYVTQLATEINVHHPDLEAALMHHLDNLFFFLADGNEWKRLAYHLATAAELPLHQQNYAYKLRYYQAVLDREQHNYKIAEQNLVELLTNSMVDPLLQARILTALGILYDQQGHFDKAIEAHGRSAKIYQQLQDIVGEGKAVNNQGIVYHELGQYDQAYTLFQHAYNLAQQADYPLLEEAALLELGYTAKATGRWEQAMTYYQTGLAMAQRLKNRDMLARFYNNLGSVNLFMGDWQAAAQNYEVALQIFLEPQYKDKREAADVYFNKGFLAFVQNLWEYARSCYEFGLKLAIEIEDLEAISEFYHRLGDLYRQKGDLSQTYHHYQAALDIIEKMLKQATQESTRIGVMGIRQQIYQAMVLCCLALERPEEALTYVQRAKSRAFLDLLARTNATETHYAEHPLTTVEIQTSLPTTTALIEFFATGQSGAGEAFLQRLPEQSRHLRHYLVPAEKLLVFVVTHQSVRVIEITMTVQQIEEQLFARGDQRLRGVTALPGQALPTTVLHRWRQLYQHLLVPLQPYIYDKEHLVFAPHSTLHYLPLHALELPHSVKATATISYIPSASAWLQARTQNKESRALLNPCLAIGVDRDGLGHAEAEAAWVAQLLGGKALLGQQATVNNVCSQLVNATIIHFSCHGVFRRNAPMNSALLLADGELTATQLLQSVRLQADLVILSACDTGLNQVTHGDELIGFTRALLGAGAQAVVMTLWQVLELPTRLFMEHFYSAWQTGATRAAALQAAQQALRIMDETTVQQHLNAYGLSNETSTGLLQQFTQMNPGKQIFDHPYYWGAFVLVGKAD